MEGHKDYENLFSAEDYVKKRFDDSISGSNNKRHIFTLTALHKVANKLPALTTSNNSQKSLLIDVGAGPCIHTVLSLSSHFDSIISSDFAAQNRAEIQKWLARDANAHSWDAVLRFSASLEKITPEELESRVRSRIVDVLPCNVLDNVPVKDYQNKADAVISSGCLECACDTLEQYKQAVHNISQLIKPGGYLILVGILGATFYHVNGVRFPVLKLSLDNIKEVLSANEMKIEYSDEMEQSSKEWIAVSDWTSEYVLLAKKL